MNNVKAINRPHILNEKIQDITANCSTINKKITSIFDILQQNGHYYHDGLVEMSTSDQFLEPETYHVYIFSTFLIVFIPDKRKKKSIKFETIITKEDIMNVTINPNLDTIIQLDGIEVTIKRDNNLQKQYAWYNSIRACIEDNIQISPIDQSLIKYKKKKEKVK